MAYVPPHKRHSKDDDIPFPTPALLTSRFRDNIKFSRCGPKNIAYSNDSISRWFANGLRDDIHLLSAFRLERTSIESNKLKNLMVLVRDKDMLEDKKFTRDGLKDPWDSLADFVLEDLFCSYENLMKVEGHDIMVNVVKPKLVARIGKVLFYRKFPIDLETRKRVPLDENSLRRMRRLFNGNASFSYVQYITDYVVGRVGLDFKEEKELYHVMFSDRSLPEYTIACKCRVVKDSDRLNHYYKIKVNNKRQMVADISCLDRDLDLRLMLYSKKKLTDLTDDEKNSINSLISSAVIDPRVGGGLRWPSGKGSSEDRFKVVGVWHTRTKTFKSSSIGLKIMSADRMDFRTSVAEVTEEVTLKMNGILSHLWVRLVFQRIETTTKFLRWPLGKDSIEDRYEILKVWHRTTKNFRWRPMRLKVVNADRLDFEASSGEVTKEVSFKMNGIQSHLQEKSIETDFVAKLLRENIKMISDYFLCCDSVIN